MWPKSHGTIARTWHAACSASAAASCLEAGKQLGARQAHAYEFGDTTGSGYTTTAPKPCIVESRSIWLEAERTESRDTAMSRGTPEQPPQRLTEWVTRHVAEYVARMQRCRQQAVPWHLSRENDIYKHWSQPRSGRLLQSLKSKTNPSPHSRPSQEACAEPGCQPWASLRIVLHCSCRGKKRLGATPGISAAAPPKGSNVQSPVHSPTNGRRWWSKNKARACILVGPARCPQARAADPMLPGRQCFIKCCQCQVSYPAVACNSGSRCWAAQKPRPDSGLRAGGAATKHSDSNDRRAGPPLVSMGTVSAAGSRGVGMSASSGNVGAKSMAPPSSATGRRHRAAADRRAQLGVLAPQQVALLLDRAHVLVALHSEQVRALAGQHRHAWHTSAWQIRCRCLWLTRWS